MKERPILFSAPMVRAILDGSKTQTRRVAPISDLIITPHPKDMVTWGVRFTKPIKGVLSSYSGGKLSDDQARSIIASQFCPYGQVGDRLWVKETHLNWWKINPGDPNGDRIFSHVAAFAADGDELQPGEKWIPSIYMLRAASRITLEITGVRVERLQDISEEDARAEGFLNRWLRTEKGPPWRTFSSWSERESNPRPRHCERRALAN